MPRRTSSHLVTPLLAVSLCLGTSLVANAQKVTRTFRTVETARIEPVLSSNSTRLRALEASPVSAWADVVSSRAVDYLQTKRDDKFQTFRLIEATEDDLGFTHVKLRRTYQNLPVIGLDVVVQLDSSGALVDVLNDNDANFSHVVLVPRITVAQAARIASGDGSPYLRPAAADAGVLVVFATLPHEPTLCWQVTDTTKDHTVYIDALSGNEVYRMPNFNSAWQDSPLNMTTTYSGFVTKLSGGYDSNIFFAKDRTRGNFYVVNANSNSNDSLSSYGIISHSQSTFSFSTNAAKATGDAFFGYEQIWDYFKFVHGRNGWDGFGSGNGILVGWPYVNGRFRDTDKALLFGSTTGDINGKTVATVDWVGHEFTHAVIYGSSGIGATNEPGALNESFADIFGTAAEFYSRRLNTTSTPALSQSYMADRPNANFLWAEGTGLDGLAANGTRGVVRSLQDPPSRLDLNGFAGIDRYENRIIGAIDDGGVHLNCGIQDKVYYLLSAGGSAYGTTVQAIGRDKAEKILFRTMTLKLGPTSQFTDARYGSCRAAADLYGYQSFEWWQVWLAWDAVGVPQSQGFPTY